MAFHQWPGGIAMTNTHDALPVDDACAPPSLVETTWDSAFEARCDSFGSQPYTSSTTAARHADFQADNHPSSDMNVIGNSGPECTFAQEMSKTCAAVHGPVPAQIELVVHLPTKAAQRRHYTRLKGLVNHRTTQHMLRCLPVTQDPKSPPRASRKKKGSSDQKSRPPALGATHPANYGVQPQQLKFQQPVLSQQQEKHSAHRPTPTLSTPRLSSCQSLPNLPWRQYNDPMWQTSSDPNYWYNNLTVLKCDSSLEVGNVTSPTAMIGLPCGGMTELAHVYEYADSV